MEDFLKNISDSYNKVAGSYTSFINELDHKPLDRDLLNRFAQNVKERGKVCDLGCGPGHMGAYLQKQGVNVLGIDLSEAMIREARLLYESIDFEVGDLFDLALDDQEVSGIVAFYSMVNIPQHKLKGAFHEMYRVLQSDGKLLLSFHVGNAEKKLDRFLDHEVSLRFYFFDPDPIIQLLEEVGFQIDETVIRYPYPDVEYPSKRAYILATRKSWKSKL